MSTESFDKKTTGLAQDAEAKMTATIDLETTADSTEPVEVLDHKYIEARENKIRRISITTLLALLGVALGYIGMGKSGISKFALSDFFAEVKLPTIEAPAQLTIFLGAIGCLVGAGVYFTLGKRRPKLAGVIAGIGAFVGLFGFLAWCIAGSESPFVVPQLFQGALATATPLVMGALAGSFGERAGVINIAIEGQLLAGAFSSALVASVTDSIVAGLVAAAASGVLVAVLMGLFSLQYRVDQVVLGVVLNTFVSGLTGFVYDMIMSGSQSSVYNYAPIMSKISIPVLSDIPLIGPILFNQTALIYLCYISVVVVIFVLNKTTWGLRVRSVGEHPKAADTVGIRVNRVKWSAILFAGIFSGLGGAYYTLVQTGSFQENISSGHGYIALAAVIMGRWRPGLATLMALFFGLVTQLGSQLQAFGTPIPSSFFLMLPYLITIVAVAGLIGLVRPPKADGVIYVK